MRTFCVADSTVKGGTGGRGGMARLLGGYPILTALSARESNRLGLEPSCRQDDLWWRAPLRSPPEYVIKNAWHEQPDNPGDVDTTEWLDQRTGIEGGG